MPPKRKHDPGYKLPEVINPEENCCICIPIPNDFNHKMAFLGQLDELGYWWNWERDDEHKGTQAAQVWRTIVECIREEIDMSGCGCGDDKPTNTRINPDTGIYEVSYDGGITWEPAPGDDPRSSGTTFPPIPGDPGAELRCTAANSVVGWAKEIQESEHEGLENNATVAEFVTVVLAALAAIGLAFALVPTAIAALLYFVINTFARAIPEDFDNQFTETTWDTLLCVVFCAVEDDGSFTEAGWQEAKSEALAMIGGYAGQWIYDHFNLIGRVGLTNAARASYAGTEPCTSCECDTACGEKYELFDQPGYPAVPGAIVAVTDTYIDLEIGATHYGLLQAKNVSDCCFVGAMEVISGSATGVAFVDCPNPFTGEWFEGTPTGRCCSFIQCQGDPGSVIRIPLGPCE